MYEDITGINYLGQMIEGTYNSPNLYYYGSLFHTYRMMLGHMMDPLHKYGVSTQHNGAIYEQMLKLTVYHLPSGSRKNGNMCIHLLYKESELHHIHQHYKLLRTAHKVLALRLSYQLTNKQTNALRH